jgi:hypothetical protein
VPILVHTSEVPRWINTPEVPRRINTPEVPRRINTPEVPRRIKRVIELAAHGPQVGKQDRGDPNASRARMLPRPKGPQPKEMA